VPRVLTVLTVLTVLLGRTSRVTALSVQQTLSNLILELFFLDIELFRFPCYIRPNVVLVDGVVDGVVDDVSKNISSFVTTTSFCEKSQYELFRKHN